MTGGEHANVSHYDGNGWIRDYPKLNNVRRDHGCGYYMNDDMKMVCMYFVLNKISRKKLLHNEKNYSI